MGGACTLLIYFLAMKNFDIIQWQSIYYPIYKWQNLTADSSYTCTQVNLRVSTFIWTADYVIHH